MTQPSRAAVQDALRQAQMSFNQGNYSAAEPIYKQMVESIPPESEEYALCLHNLGEINEQRGNLTTAIWWQMRLLSHDLMTHESMTHHLFSRMGHIAALYTKAGRPSEAQQLYHQMQNLQPRLAGGSPGGFEPKSEVGNFLRGVFDACHKKYSADPAEGQQTRDALSQLVGPGGALQPHAVYQAPGQIQQAPAPTSANPPQFQPPPSIANPPQQVPPQQFPPQPLPAQPVPPQPTGQQYAAGAQMPPPAGQQQLTGVPAAAPAAPAGQQWTPSTQPNNIGGAAPLPAVQKQKPQAPAPQPRNNQSGPAPIVLPWGNSTSQDVPPDYDPNQAVYAPEDSAEEGQQWTQQLESNEQEPADHQTFGSRASARQAAKQAAKKEQPAQAAANKAKAFDLDELENIPAPSKARPKPSASRSYGAEEGPSYLAANEDPKSFISGAPRDSKPPSKTGFAQPEWEPPKRGKAPKALKSKEFKRDSLSTDADYASRDVGAAKGAREQGSSGPRGGGGEDDSGDGEAPKRGARRIGLSGPDEIDDAPSEMNSNMQGMAAAWTQLSNSKNAPILFLGVVLLVVFGVFQMPYGGRPVTQFSSMPKRFKTVDGSKLFGLITLNECELEVGKEVQRCSYKFYFGDWREAVFLALGQLPEKQYWLTDTKKALVDEAGTTFYDAGGPEKKLYAAADAISQAVSRYYLAHDNKYPTSATEIGAAELTYENPYTKQNEVADIQSLALGDTSGKKGDIARSDIYDKLQRGLGWDNERKLGPGAINCCQIEITTARGLIQAFVIQAGDENGVPIMGSNGNQHFFKSMEDGKIQEQKPEPLPFVSDSTMRKRVVVVLEKPVDSGMAFIIHSAACWLYSLLAFVSAAVYFSLPKRSGGKVVAIGMIVLFGLIATIYAICARL